MFTKGSSLLLRASFVAALLSTWCAPRTLHAQDEVARELERARAALEQDDPEAAERALLRALDLRPDEAELHWRLGQARALRGDAAGALAAWRRTLELAPQHRRARERVALLEGHARELGLRLAWIEELVEAGLDEEAARALEELRAAAPEGDAVLARSLALRTLLLARAATPDAAQILASLAELELRFPAPADPERELLRARAELAAERRASGLARLEALVRTGAEISTEAGLELLLARRDGGGERAEELEAWCAAHPEHPRANEALRAALDERIRFAERAPALRAEDELGEADRAVIALVQRLVRADAPPRANQVVLQRAMKFLAQREVAGGSEARCAGLELLLEAAWTPAQRGILHAEHARQCVERALHVLEARAASGALDRLEGSVEALPALARALAAWRAQRAISPRAPEDEAALRLAIALEEAARSRSAAMPRTVPAPRRWALELARELASVAADDIRARASELALPVLEQVALLDRAAAIAAGEALLATRVAHGAHGDHLRLRVSLWLVDEFGAAADDAAREKAAEALTQFLTRSIERRPSSAALFAEELGSMLAGPFSAAADADGASRWLALWKRAEQALAGTAAERLALRRGTARVDRVLRALRIADAAGLLVPALVEEARAIAGQLDELQGRLAEASELHAKCGSERTRLVQAFEAADPRAAFAEEILAQDASVTPRVAGERALLRFELALQRARRALPAELARLPRPEEAPVQLARALERYAALEALALDAAALAPRHESVLLLGAELAQRGALPWALACFAAVERGGQRSAELAARARFSAASARRAAGLARRSGAATSEAELGALLEGALDDYAAILREHPRTSAASACLGAATGLALDLARAGAWESAQRALRRFEAAAPPLRAPDVLQLAIAIADVGDLLGDAGVGSLERALGTAPPEEPAPLAETAHRPAGPGAPASGAASDEFQLGAQLFVGRIAADAAPSPDQRLFELQRSMAAALAQRAARQVAEQAQQEEGSRANAAEPALPEAEIARRSARFEAVRAALQRGIDELYPAARAAVAREVFQAIAAHWARFGLHAVESEFLTAVAAADAAHPRRAELRLEAALALLRHAASAPSARDAAARAALEQRYHAAREALRAFGADLELPRALRERAIAEAARSFLAQARSLAAPLGLRARGPFVRAARELARAAEAHPENPALASLGGELLALGDELTGLGLAEGAVEIWRTLLERLPTDPAARAAATRIAATYATALDRPLAAVEAYLELHHLAGGADPDPAAQILALAQRLQEAQRWVEALHALEVFVEGFPAHPLIAQALERIGAVHAENGAWNAALAAYRRVIQEHEGTPVAHEARWATARAWIHLSKWREAEEAYRVWLERGGEEARRAEAERRMAVLRDLARHQALVDEPGQRKAFDAQFQIARIVAEQLGELGKATLEYAQVAQRWPESHLADDALYQVGLLRFQRGEIEEGRSALLDLARRYPSSPSSDDALFAVGQSFEREADALERVTRTSSLAQANEVAQKRAYQMVADNRREQLGRSAQRLAEAKKISRDEADREAAYQALVNCNFDFANTQNVASWVSQQIELLSAEQLADRQDKIHAALRRAVGAFEKAAQVASGDKADQALLELARIQDSRLGDADAALRTWSAIATQYAGTAVAEDASWRLAEAYRRRGRHAEAVESYGAFVRNYRRSARAEVAQMAIAEGLEHLGRWIEAMDAYQRYLESFPEGGSAARAREQIAWIKTYRL